MAGSRSIAAAIVRSAEVRAALEHLAWNLDVGVARIEARVLTATARVLRNTARLWRVRFMLLRIPVGRPFPDIPDHVVDAVAVRREGRDRGGAIEAVGEIGRATACT